MSPIQMAGLVFLLVLPATSGDLGGHEEPKPEIPALAAKDERKATLEEMWQRRLLPPDQNAWSPQDFELLKKIRRAEKDALGYLRDRPGGERPWTAKPRFGGPFAAAMLTKEGYERYVSLLTQDAVELFESKGAEAVRVFQLRDWDGKPMFDRSGRITEAGSRVYHRARLNLEIYWKDPSGDVYGTRRPPTKKP